MYVLDTDICSYLMKRTQPALIERVKAFASRELKVSVITLFELEYGVLRSERRDHLRRVVRAFLENVEVLTWTASAASEAGAVRAELAVAGSPIGAYDLQIAGHARSLGATLVTKIFESFLVCLVSCWQIGLGTRTYSAEIAVEGIAPSPLHNPELNILQPGQQWQGLLDKSHQAPDRGFARFPSSLGVARGRLAPTSH